eukprot:TRINITY_DN257_c0_g1_i1.p1 TRINITY_DN257_c0_g1~~TRINITY_DN257_c0_g1_i1.p1  ORF type:complete len:318 (-),score=57.10 TRINITY_DN257_c0_g1_i1:902-1855(-)
MCVGNTIVAKPSEMTSVTAWMLCSIFQEAKLPPGVINIVFGTGPKAGAALVAHPDVPLISFTGGTKTGEIISKTAAPMCKKLSLELGGKNPNVIFADADMANAVSTSIRSSFANQGEICLCGSRIYVQREIFDKFVKEFVEATKKIKVGDPVDSETNMGALISKEHKAKVLSYIKLAQEEGGKVLVGGDEPKLEGDLQNGYFVNPTVIVGLQNCARTQQEEIFGPVVTVAPFDTEAEAIELANDVVYGLSASVHTRDLARAHRVAAKIQAGTVWVNTWLKRDLRVPFGGMKQSGTGREGGKFSIDFYTEQKNICIAI